MLIRTSTLSVVLAAALIATGCGDSGSKSGKTRKQGQSAHSQAKTVTGGAVTFTPNGKTVVKLKSNGISMVPTRGAKQVKSAVAVDVDSGEVVSATLIGSARGGGGLVFQRGSRKVAFTDLVVNTSRRRVTGVVGGKRVSIFQLKLAGLKRAETSKTRVSGTGIGATFTSTAAELLDKGLAVKAFTRKMPFGTIELALVVHKGSGSSSSKNGTTTKTTQTGK